MRAADDLLKARRVLVIAPHPDDEVLGAGGTVARLSEAGPEVTIAVVTKGAPNCAPTVETGSVLAAERDATSSMRAVAPRSRCLRFSLGESCSRSGQALPSRPPPSGNKPPSRLLIDQDILREGVQPCLVAS